MTLPIAPQPTPPGGAPPLPPRTAGPSLEAVLSEQANAAMQAGKDPQAVTARLGQIVTWLRANPHVATQANAALAQGKDPQAVALRAWQIAQRGGAPAAPAARPREMPGGTPGAFIEGVANGAVLGGGAYAGGFLDTLLDPSSYRGHFRANLSGNIAKERALLHGYQAAHPVATTVGEVGGGILPAVAAEPLSLASALGKAGTAARIAGQVADGALIGGTSGALSADPGQTMSGATRGAVAGGILGAAVPAAARAVGAVPAAARALAGTSSEDRALGKLAAQLAEHHMTPADLSRAGHEAVAAGTPAVVGDLMGSLGRRAVQWTVGQPSGEGANLLAKLEDRNAGQYDRILGRVQDAMGQRFQNMPQTSDALLDARRQAAGPAYAKAYAKGPVMTPTLQEAMRDPDFAKAIAKGRALKAKMDLGNGQAAEPAPAPAPTWPDPTHTALYQRLLSLNGNDPKTALAGMRALGIGDPVSTAPAADAPVPIDVLDYAKRYLDTGIRRGFDAQSGFDHTTATATNRVLSKVLDEVDAQVTEYAAARQQYHSDSRMLDALELGRSALTMHPDELAAAVQGLSPAEQEVARAGFLDAVRQKAGSVDDRNDLTKRFVGDPNTRARFAAFAPSPAAMQQIRSAAEREAELAKTLNVAKGGSNTVDKAMFAAAMADGPRASDLAVFPVSPHRTLVRLAGRAGQAITLRANGRLADALAPLLGTEAGSPGFDELVQRLTQYGDPSMQKAIGAGRRAVAGRTVAALGGEAAGRAQR